MWSNGSLRDPSYSHGLQDNALALGGLTLLLALVLGVVGLPWAADGQENESGSWTRLADAPVPRFETASAEVEGKLYLFGGFGGGGGVRCDVLDPSDGSWTALADLPSAVTHLNAAVDGRTVWFAGGFAGPRPSLAVADVWRYDVDRDTFSAGPPLPAARAGGGLARVGRKLHYFGGLRDRNHDADDHWTLDLDEGLVWKPSPPMPEARNQFGVAVLDGLIYAIGGQFGHDEVIGDPLDQGLVHIYDPEAGAWRRGPDLPGPRSHIEPSTFVHDGRIVIVGGRGPKDGYHKDILALAPGDREWSSFGELPVQVLGAASRMLGDRLFVVSGSSVGYSAVPEVWSR